MNENNEYFQILRFFFGGGVKRGSILVVIFDLIWLFVQWISVILCTYTHYGTLYAISGSNRSNPFLKKKKKLKNFPLNKK